MLAVIDEALGSGRAVTKKSSKVVPRRQMALHGGVVEPVSHCMTWCSSGFVRPFFSTLATSWGTPTRSWS
jgi:hypothetical protein